MYVKLSYDIWWFTYFRTSSFFFFSRFFSVAFFRTNGSIMINLKHSPQCCCSLCEVIPFISIHRFEFNIILCAYMLDDVQTMMLAISNRWYTQWYIPSNAFDRDGKEKKTTALLASLFHVTVCSPTFLSHCSHSGYGFLMIVCLCKWVHTFDIYTILMP